jgi:hypothetical protein
VRLGGEQHPGDRPGRRGLGAHRLGERVLGSVRQRDDRRLRGAPPAQRHLVAGPLGRRGEHGADGPGAHDRDPRHGAEYRDARRGSG